VGAKSKYALSFGEERREIQRRDRKKIADVYKNPGGLSKAKKKR